MDATVSGSLKLQGNKEAIDKMAYFIENEFDEEDIGVSALVRAIENGEAEYDIDEDITIEIEQSYEFLRSTDYTKDIVEFVKQLVKKVPGLTQVEFNGLFEVWSSGEFIRFVCNFSDGVITAGESDIVENDDYDDDELRKMVMEAEITKRRDLTVKMN